MLSLDAGSLALIKYEPQEILFLHKTSRTVYRYFNSSEPQLASAISHPCILSGVPFDQGLLYPKEQSTLLSEINTRARSHIKKLFSQEQIANTFIPLFECLSHIHHQKGFHGSIHPQNILIIEDQIKIRDSRAPTELTSSYYGGKKQQKIDVWALGMCLINCILLTTEKPDQNQLQNLPQKIFQSYSKTFIILVMIISKQKQSQYRYIPELIEGSFKNIDEKLVEQYEAMKSEREKKKKLLANEEILGFNHINTIKKIGSNGNAKKNIHFDNSQNKLEEQRKKSTEKLNKAMEKCSISHELMSKKLNQEEKKMNEESLKRFNKTPILNLSNFGVENNNKKQKDRISPLQRPKNYSKKK